MDYRIVTSGGKLIASADTISEARSVASGRKGSEILKKVSKTKKRVVKPKPKAKAKPKPKAKAKPKAKPKKPVAKKPVTLKRNAKGQFKKKSK